MSSKMMNTSDNADRKTYFFTHRPRETTYSRDGWPTAYSPVQTGYQIVRLRANSHPSCVMFSVTRNRICGKTTQD
jgi:hypothetical protein